MKKIILSVVLLTLLVMPVSFADYGAAAAQNDKDLQVLDMLTYAIQDEYLARAEYNLIMDTFDVARPFSNIERAENMHIAWITDLFRAYGYALPEDQAAVTAPAALAEAFQAGVTAEEVNIDMYERFLKLDLPDDIRAVFEALKRSSENHLRAFEQNTQTVRRASRGSAGRWNQEWQPRHQNNVPNTMWRGF